MYQQHQHIIDQQSPIERYNKMTGKVPSGLTSGINKSCRIRLLCSQFLEEEFHD